VSLALLQRTFAAGGPVMSPFFVLGDPDPSTSEAMLVAAIDAGARVLELGIPYSDPCADGPAIQAACARARAAGVSTAAALSVLAAVHRARPGVAFNLLVYGNLVHAWGAERFCAALAAAGGSTLLVPDLPLEDAGDLRRACRAHGLGWVPLVTPSTSPQRLRALDAAADAFLYVTAVQGVTGAASAGGPRRDEVLAAVAAHTTRPLCLGFGLSAPADVREAFAGGAALAVVGSHLARVIEAGVAQGATRSQHVAAITAALGPLLAAAPAER